MRFVIVKSFGEGSKVTALSRGTRDTKPRWVVHERLQECFVHSAKMIRRAMKKGRQWTKEAVLFYEAEYNPDTGYAELTEEGAVVPFAEMKEALLGD